MFRTFIRRVGATLPDHPLDAWLDIAHSFNCGTRVLGVALEHSELEASDLLELARGMNAAQVDDDGLREIVAAQLRIHGEDTIKAAWYELGWAELGRELVNENPASIPIEQAAQLLTADELVNVYMASGQPLTDELVDLLAQAKSTTNLGIIPLTDAQVSRLYAPTHPYTAHTSRLLNWIWSCCTPQQRVAIVETDPAAAKRHGRTSLSQFKSLIEAGLDVKNPQHWELLDPLMRHDWDAEPNVKKALIDYGPAEKYVRVELTADDKVRLIERAEAGTVEADFVIDRITDDDNLSTQQRTRLLLAWATAKGNVSAPTLPRWVTPEDLENVRKHSSSAAERLIEAAIEKAYSGISASGAVLLVPHVPLDWSRVRDSYVWKLAAAHLTTQLEGDTRLWHTATTLLDNWHGSLEELVRFARSVN